MTSRQAANRATTKRHHDSQAMISGGTLGEGATRLIESLFSVNTASERHDVQTLRYNNISTTNTAGQRWCIVGIFYWIFFLLIIFDLFMMSHTNKCSTGLMRMISPIEKTREELWNVKCRQLGAITITPSSHLISTVAWFHVSLVRLPNFCCLNQSFLYSFEAFSVQKLCDYTSV